ncbi:MAG: zf-HC2 domain-containing protein [Ignavibacteriales bacterium]|nr:zf-HC2 domain-containing protein [Ignavibacteriales bacterium]
MKHSSIQNKLLLYLDGSLNDVDMSEVERHLPQCPHCNNQLAVLSTIWEKKAAIDKFTTPPFLWTRVQSRMSNPAQKSASGILLYALKTTTAIILLLISFFIGNYLGKLPSTETEMTSNLSTTEYIARSYHFDSFEPISEESIGQAIILTSSQNK